MDVRPRDLKNTIAPSCMRGDHLLQWSELGSIQDGFVELIVFLRKLNVKQTQIEFELQFLSFQLSQAPDSSDQQYNLIHLAMSCTLEIQFYYEISPLSCKKTLSHQFGLPISF